jgi:hypothetical protein
MKQAFICTSVTVVIALTLAPPVGATSPVQRLQRQVRVLQTQVGALAEGLAATQRENAELQRQFEAGQKAINYNAAMTICGFALLADYERVTLSWFAILFNRPDPQIAMYDDNGACTRVGVERTPPGL